MQSGKSVDHLEKENKTLNDKMELIKRKVKNDNYKNEKLNENISKRIMKIFNIFVKYKYIKDKDIINLDNNSSSDTIKNLLMHLSIVEKNIIALLKFKKEVIDKDPILKKQFVFNSKYEAMNRKKIKEQNQKLINIKKTMDKLNKIKYIKEQKDFYNINRVFIIKKEKEKKLSKEIDNTKRKKTSIEKMLDID